MSSAPALARRLGLADAVAIGLGSMLGAGIFAAFAPAALAAGAGLLVGLAVAAAVAFCNATSSAQLAAQYPASGGAYLYGRERLGPWTGFFAGWSFVVGKTASCAAMALTFAAYASPAGWEKPIAVAAVLLLSVVNLLGVTRTAFAAKVIVTLVVLVLLVVIAVGVRFVAGDAGAEAPGGAAAGPDAYGILQSAGLLFFAFAGYARIATMGEEVRDPARTIPRAIVLSLTTVLILYAAIGVLILAVLGPQKLAASTAPLVDLVEAAGASWAEPIVLVGASLGALGALLALIAGIGRTTLAMARNDDVPKWLAAIHPTTRVPFRAEILLTLLLCLLVLTVDLRAAIGFSSFGVLLYYLVANVAAFTQNAAHRRYPRPLQVVGAIGCIALVVTLPWASIVGGCVVLLIGVGYRFLRTGAREAER